MIHHSDCEQCLNQDVHQLSAFIHECFLAQALGDDPVDV